MTRRRANGEGTEPGLRKDGRWQASYTGADGRRRVVTTPRGSTRSACRDALRAAIRRTEEGIAPLDGRLTVGRWLDTWQQDYVAGGARPRRAGTIASYRSVVENHLRPRLGQVVLARLTREQVNQALGGVASTGVSPNTVPHVFHILRIALNEAVRSEKLRANPCLRLDPPEAVTTVLAPWDSDEINRFLDSLEGNRHAPLFKFAISSGLRRGELLGLRWSDVDLEAGVLTVDHQLLRDGSFGPPKSAAGVRTIGLSELAVYALRAQRGRQAAQRLRAGRGWRNVRDLVFTTDTGSHLGWRPLWHAFRLATRDAGVRQIRFHDLRHACATLLLTGGEELAVISKVLGHADYGTTLKVYAHLDPKRAKAAAGRIDAALGWTLPALEEVAT
jgi:integrase